MGVRIARKPVLYSVPWGRISTMMKATPPRVAWFLVGVACGVGIISVLQSLPSCGMQEELDTEGFRQERRQSTGDTSSEQYAVETPAEQEDYEVQLESREEAGRAHVEQTDYYQVLDEQSSHKVNTENMTAPSQVPIPAPGRDLVAADLYGRVRVLCWIMTHQDNLATKASAVRATWARRCHTVLYVSDQENREFLTIPVNVSRGREYLPHKTLQAFQYIYDHHLEDADWFLKADDDTYVIMENLRYLLSQHNPSDPVYFGHPFRPWVDQGYFSGGSGYVISHEALRRFGQRDQTAKKCHGTYGGSEDVMFGRCMEFLGVRTGETRDKHLRSRFHAMDAGTHITGGFPDWYYFYDALHGQSGMDSISEYSISFHYVKPKDMYTFEFLIYKLKTYGLDAEQTDTEVNVTSQIQMDTIQQEAMHMDNVSSIG